MSAVSGSQTKGEASKKYKSVNINNIFKGKSIETTSKTVIPKHGMQSLGKVAAVRRIPPPANLPSLKAENCGNDPNINLVPAGGQGWGKKAEETTSGVPNSSDGLGPLLEVQIREMGLTQNTEVANTTQIPHCPSSTASGPPAQPITDSKTNATNSSGIQSTISCSVPSTNITSNTATDVINTRGVGKGGKVNPSLGVTAQGPIPRSGLTAGPPIPWSSGASVRGGAPLPTQPLQLDGGPQPASSVQQSPFFHREFPTLGGGSSLAESTPQYGPGPSLRPETKGSWALGGGRGVAPAQPDDRCSSSTNTSAAFNGEIPHASRPGNMGHGTSALGMPLGSGGGSGLGALPSGPPSSSSSGGGGNLSSASIPTYLSLMGHSVPPHQYRGPHARGGTGMPRSQSYIPSGRPPFPVRYRGSVSHDDDSVVVPPPIIKKEDLDEFEPLPPESDAWANSALDVDYNKKLNFSEDEGSAEDDRGAWRSERAKEKREKEAEKRNAKVSESGDRNHTRERGAEEKKHIEEKRDRYERNLPSYDASSRWQPPNAHPPASAQQPPLRIGYESTSRGEYTRKSASPGSTFEDDGSKRREMEEVQAALDRARVLEQEEEKRYEEKKRFDQAKRGRDHSDVATDLDGSGAGGDQLELGSGREARGGLGTSSQDGRDANRDRDSLSWDSHSDSAHDKGRDYRHYADRRDTTFRDQYDNGRLYDRREREQPVFSSTFKSKLPPRFQKQQQQQGPPSHRGAQPLHQPPSLFDPRYNSSYRHSGRQETSRARRGGNEADSSTELSDNRSSSKSWAISGWSLDERDEQLSSQSQPYTDRLDRSDARLRDEYIEKSDREVHWGNFERREFGDRERDGRSRGPSDKYDYDYSRRRLGDRGWDDKKRFDSTRSRDDHPDLADSESKVDWRHEQRPSLMDGVEKTVAGDCWKNPKDWEKDDDHRERPQRPDSRDSRGSRESRTSKDSVGSVTQREKKLDMTSWADSTSEFDDYYRSNLKGEQQQSRPESLLKDLTLHDTAPRSEFQDPAYGEMVGNQELSKENFRSGMAPAPITKERLEASENEKEVRKNMTTLRRHQEPSRRNPPRETTVSAPTVPVSTTPTTATPSLPRDGHHNLVWSNSKTKNGDRSRPDTNGTMVQTCVNPSSPLNTSNSTTSTPNTTATPNATTNLESSSKNSSEVSPLPTSGSTGAGTRDKGLCVGLTKSSHSANPPTKKEPDSLWSQRSSKDDPVLSANLQANAADSLEEKGKMDKGQCPVGSKNQSEARMSAPQTSNTVQQQQKNQSSGKDDGVAPSKKVVEGRTPITPAQGSLSTASSTIEGSTNPVEKPAREKGTKVGVQSQKGSRATGVNRYDSSASSTSTRGGRGGRSSSGSFSLYRGRGSRTNDYRRGSSAARRGNPPRFQDNRNLRTDDYHYLYEYTPSRKDGSLGDAARYGGAMWARTGDRRGRTHVGRSCTAPEVPSLMEADLRKQPNARYERIPPRFLRKREQEQHGPSTKDKKSGVTSIGGNLSNDKASLPLQSGRAPPKESSPEVTEDNDWETASENSDPDRQKEGKEKLGRDQKYGTVRLDKKSCTAGPWQKTSTGGGTVMNGVGAGTSSTPGKESTMTAYSRCLDVQKHPKKGAASLKDVSLMGNHEPGSSMIDELFDSNSGFQEVTRKRARDKHRLQEERPNGSVSPSGHDAPFSTGTSKRQEKKKKGKSSGFERSRQNKLPPRFARKRENPRNKEEDFSSSSFFKDTIVAPPPPKNAWEKPLTAALSTNASQQSSTQDATLKSNVEVAQENHDSGVEVSDPPNSTGSSQRSSPSDNPVFSRQDKGPSNVATARQDKTISSSTLSFRVDKSVLDGSSVPSQTIIFENTNFKAAGTVTVGSEYKAKFGGDLPKPQRPGRKSHSPPDMQVGTRDELDKRDKPEPIELPLSFSKADETAADMKLDFTFDHELAELNTEKTGRPSSSLTRSSLSLSSPASPSTHDLNLKIASVKKVWDTMTPLPEHPEDSVSTFPSNFSGVEKVSGLDHPPVIESSFSSKEAVGVEESASEVGYQAGSPMQQASGMTAAAAAVAMVYTSAASLAKAEVSRPGNVCKVKPQQQTTCNNTSISPVLPGNSISPPLPSAGHSSNMYLGGNPAFGGIGGAIPSPPTVMFNSSQQLPQTGLFQPLFDGTPVMGQRGASQFSQYPYGIGQGLGSSAFGQQSMFLQTPPPPLSAPPDPYTNSLSQYRLQPNPVTAFGQSQQPAPQNQSTVLISSASTTLMSSAVKPSTHTFGSSQQNFGTIGSKAGTPFQQSGLGGALQGAPQPSVYIFDPSHSIGLLNSQLVQRPGVQSSVIQTIQTPSSFYSNNGAGTPGGPPAAPPAGPTGPQQAAAGYYTASGSPLQAAVQQQPQPPLQTPPAFSLQGFGNQSGPGTVGVQNFSSGINLTAQQQIAAFRNNPANFLKSLQPGSSMPDVTRQQIKSPSSAHNSFASSYFPIASASSGAAISHCGGSNGPTNGHTTNMPNTVSGNPANINISSGLGGNTGSGGANINTPSCVQNSTQMSPKSQNRKMGGQPMTSSSGRAGGYHPQVQMSAGGGLRTNMVLGMRTQQLGMPGTSSVTPSVMTAPPQRYPGPGPIQRPQNAVGPGGVPSTQANRSVRGHPHQPPSSLHNASTQQQQRSSNPSSAQQAKLRADALSTTQAFFGRDAGTKSDKKLDGPASSPSPSSSSSEVTVGKECSSSSAADVLTSGAAPVTQQASISK